MSAAGALPAALPLAHHQTVTALPVFAPALIVGAVLAFHYLRERRRSDDSND